MRAGPDILRIRAGRGHWTITRTGGRWGWDLLDEQGHLRTTLCHAGRMPGVVDEIARAWITGYLVGQDGLAAHVRKIMGAYQLSADPVGPSVGPDPQNDDGPREGGP